MAEDNPASSSTEGAAVPAESGLQRLVEIMRILRGPQGCPWDREQDRRSLRRYVLEEAYEVVQAIDDADDAALVGELGDLLLQIVFLSRLATEAGTFTVDDVVDAICDKLVRRHPHVFGEAAAETPDEVVQRWEELKLEERGGGSVLDDLPASLPALARAEKLGRRAAQLGFDWADHGGVLEKVNEEIDELRAAIASTSPSLRSEEVEEEVGDLLFSVANLARHLGLSPEVALRRAGEKFERRFRAIEPDIAAGRATSLDEMERLWQETKD